MRDHPSVARRHTPLALVIGLVTSVLPFPAVAQVEGPTVVANDFVVTGDAGQANAEYEWTITTSGQRWHLEAIAGSGEQVQLRLRDGDGIDLGSTSATERAALFDLDLEPGTYGISVVEAGGQDHGFALQGSVEPVQYAPEPDDRMDQAGPLEDGVPVIGRLARTGSDTDHFRFTVPDGDTRLRDVTLTTTSEVPRELCLLDEMGERLQCRDASKLPLRDLALDPGEYVVRVEGSVDERESYELLVAADRPRSAGFEAEPNDGFATASAVDPLLGLSGRSAYGDEDVLALEVVGDGQLWQVRASGEQLDYLRWLRAGTQVVAQASPGCDGSAAVLDDLYLAPGTHRFLVRTCAGDYVFAATPLGLPAAEAEREPNSDDVRAEPYLAGERRVGRLTDLEDRDYFRFTLTAPELLDFQLRQPADAEIRATIRAGETPLYVGEALEPGKDVRSQLSLQPGDYLLELRAMTPSEGQYEFLTRPRDPWLAPPDAEPNDDPGTARPAPAGLEWSGLQDTRSDDRDAVWLPALPAAGPIRIEVANEGAAVRLFRGPARDEQVDVQRQDDGSYLAAEAPAGEPLYLEIEADGAYDVTVTAPGLDDGSAPAVLPVRVDVTAASDRLAAYWPEGQRVDAEITLTSEAGQALELELAASSSHYAWTLVPESSRVMLDAGASVTVPARVTTRADLWADVPVRFYVTAQAADDAYATGSFELVADRETDAVGSHLAWPVPDALLGGLNVAGAALGALPGGTVAPDQEVFLYDDLTPANTGFGFHHDGSPLELTVDLAGDGPIPVAGVILDPLARGSRLDDVPRLIEVDLSLDGQAWQTVLRAEMTPLPIDQSFVLEAPTDASHARLRILSTHGPDPSVRGVALGEWKVIATPGAVPDTMPANIAEPVRGGHVARHSPHLHGLEHWARLLDDDLKRQAQSRDLAAGEALDIVVGFQEGRAARIDGVRWHDPVGTDPTQRADEVSVAVTTTGPAGPWRSLGTWVLERSSDGSVAPFDLAEPEWARYVRLTAAIAPDEVRSLEFPGKIEVLEQPTDGEYRSILGEWGYTSDRGPFELLEPGIAAGLELSADAGDTRDVATAIDLGKTRFDRAAIDEDEDWYRVHVPVGQNRLRIDLEGIPSLGVGVVLFDVAGEPVLLQPVMLDGRSEAYEAIVAPGDHYLHIEQPPFSVAFTFDTSGSMGPYLDYVLEGMRVFASDVQPGREMAMILPIDRPPLIDTWQDDPAALEAAVNDYDAANESSDIEVGLLDSVAVLRDREGTRAILAVADAETGTLNLANDVWTAFEAESPHVYTVHVGADRWPEETRNLMRAWSDAGAGVYSYPTTHAEMERAFERMSTHLRRPATYGLTVTADFADLRPGTLEVFAPEGEPVQMASDAGMALILDTSGSMNKRLDGQRRIDIAKASMKQLVRTGLAEGVPVSLRVFGGEGKRSGCRTSRLVPLGPLDRSTTIRLIDRLAIRKNTGTPIAAALRWVARDLAGVEGERLVVLITDGKATCEADPEVALAELRAAGIEISLNIVGFALDDEILKAQMRGWAEATGGRFYDADDAEALTRAVKTAVAAPVEVFTLADDELPVAVTTVGAPAIELAPGEYRVVVRSEPVQQVTVEILPAGSTRYELTSSPA